MLLHHFEVLVDKQGKKGNTFVEHNELAANLQDVEQRIKLIGSRD
jgi:hypothetical protein